MIVAAATEEMIRAALRPVDEHAKARGEMLKTKLFARAWKVGGIVGSYGASWYARYKDGRVVLFGIVYVFSFGSFEKFGSWTWPGGWYRPPLVPGDKTVV